MKIGILLVLTLTAFAGLVSMTPTVRARDVKPLFVLNRVPEAKSEAARSSIASVREAAIEIDGTTLRDGLSSLALPLFDGQTRIARRSNSEGSEVRALDDLTWRGRITEGKFIGDVVLTYRRGFLAGIIYAPDAVYEIVPKGSEQILVQLDQSLYPPCAGGIKGEENVKERSSSAAGVNTDSGDRIDVLVLYTAAVRTSAGGDAQAQTIAQQAIDSTNTSYINSKIRQRVRLVGAQLTALVETGNFSTELSNLRADAPTGTLRNSVNADLVDMLTNSTAACGIGYLMGAASGNQNNGFTVTARTCAVGNLSFAHELGHNMGSQHNPENGGTATYPYGYGHYVNGVYRTVMSYVDPCTAGCTRVAYFSNPYVTFSGSPTGLENARDNARSINNTADWIANYRYSGSSIEMNVLNNAEMVPRLIKRNITWTSDNITGNVRIDFSRNEGTTWQTIVASTPNDGGESVAMPGNPTRRARLRIVSLANTAVSDSSVINFSVR